jgi:hypothetical protein
MFQQLVELIVGDSAVVEVNHSQVFLCEVVREKSLKVGGPRSEDDLVGVNWLAFYHEGHIAEFSLVEEAGQVSLILDLWSDSEVVHVALGHALLGDRGQTPGKSGDLGVTRHAIATDWHAQALRDLAIDLGRSIGILACTCQADRVLTNVSAPLLVGLARFPIDLLVVVPRSVAAL